MSSVSAVDSSSFHLQALQQQVASNSRPQPSGVEEATETNRSQAEETTEQVTPATQGSPLNIRQVSKTFDGYA
jgi:hypothetical protein